MTCIQRLALMLYGSDFVCKDDNFLHDLWSVENHEEWLGFVSKCTGNMVSDNKQKLDTYILSKIAPEWKGSNHDDIPISDYYLIKAKKAVLKYIKSEGDVSKRIKIKGWNLLPSVHKEEDNQIQIDKAIEKSIILRNILVSGSSLRQALFDFNVNKTYLKTLIADAVLVANHKRVRIDCPPELKMKITLV